MHPDQFLYDRSQLARVRFSFQQDRYGHAIEIYDDENWATVLRSCDGNATDPWPSSPPIQQLHNQEMEQHQACFFGVGKAGASHWSTSIDSPKSSILQFDFACRLTKHPSRLGSQYEIDSSAKTGVFGAFVELRIKNHRFFIKCEDPNQSITQNNTNLTIQPDLFDLVLPMTIRWKYVVEFSLTATNSG